METMNLVANFASLAVILCGVLVVMLLPAFPLSAPGWMAGRLAASNSPQVRTVRASGFYWLVWAVLGGGSLAVSAIGGPFASTSQFIPTPAAVIIALLGLAILNASAFFIGYKQGLAARAKKEIRKGLRSNTVIPGETVDVLDQNHPALATDVPRDPVATTPLPVVDADRPSSEDAPTQEIAVRRTDSPNDEYPTARPVGY